MKYFTFRNCLALLTLAVGLVNASCNSVITLREQRVSTKIQIDSTIADDPAYVRLYAPYKDRLEAEMNRVVGRTNVALTKPANAPETLLGNFFADALLAEGRKLYPDAAFSFGTKGGLRIELQPGDITVGHLFELMPFENELVILELRGKSISELAQFIASTGGQPVAGMRMRIADSGATDILIGNTPLDTARTYTLVTYDYLANGGDNSRGLNDPVNRINLGKKVRDALIDYVSRLAQEGKHINPKLDGRIIQAR
ncbi:5'-nucleotidase C-terminal domain-containing protein [Parapedobacter deserti]|uniref:5'-nucleotidase C-terminal domain-containing protein n=1 Tax=Parapedobacter deserti TaxID=1912957 RepID=A0ABV7JI53_9SPHI